MPPFAGADTTPYASKGYVVEPQFRAMLHAEGVPQDLRMRLAEMKIDTVSKFALLGRDQAAFETKIEGLMSTLIGTDAVKIQNVTLLAVVWEGCVDIRKFKLTQRMRLQEEPHKIPEIHSTDFGDMRERFVTAHPDIVLTERNEPHKKFVEKVDRDLQVHGVCQFYELCECRVRKDKITPRSGFSTSLEGLLKTAEVAEEATINNEEDALNRITAFLIMCSYLNINAFRSSSYTEGGTDGCGLSYLATLNDKRSEFPGDDDQRYNFVVIADRKIRKRVAKLTQDKRAKYPSFSSAISHVLKEESELWKDARSEALATRSKRARSRTPEKLPRPTAQGTSDAEAKLQKIKEAKKLKRQKKAEKKKAKKGGGKGNGGSGQQNGVAPPPVVPAGAQRTKDGRKMADPALFKKVNELCKGKKTCPFYNLPGGCKFDSACAKDHICAQCGQAHPFHSAH